VHFLQIWIEPEQRGLTPGYEQIAFSDADLSGGFRLIGARDGREGAITIHQDVDLYAARLEPDTAAEFWPRADRMLWLQMAHGRASLNGELLEAGDGVALIGEASLRLEAETNIEALLFDMAGREEDATES
jgi:quercetin 2,3-dioxygenase